MPGGECGSCGGAGCGDCGGLGCTGSLTTSEDALRRAEEAAKEFERKLNESESVLAEVSCSCGSVSINLCVILSHSLSI